MVLLLCGSALSQGARQLHTIFVHDCARITDLGLQALGSRPPTCVPYETIDISSCPRIGDAGVLALLHGCSALTSLNMADCPKVRPCRGSPPPSNLFRLFCVVCLSFGSIGQNCASSVTKACVRRPGAAASVSRRRREHRILLAGGSRRTSRSHTLAASQAFERMRTLFAIGENFGTPRYPVLCLHHLLDRARVVRMCCARVVECGCVCGVACSCVMWRPSAPSAPS